MEQQSLPARKVSKPEVCPECLGSGTIMSTTWRTNPWREEEVECPTCKGAGQLSDDDE